MKRNVGQKFSVGLTNTCYFAFCTIVMFYDLIHRRNLQSNLAVQKVRQEFLETDNNLLRRKMKDEITSKNFNEAALLTINLGL